jgi:hypothetical protein
MDPDPAKPCGSGPATLVLEVANLFVATVLTSGSDPDPDPH